MTYQAIEVKNIPATDKRGARVKAFATRGSLTLPWNHALNQEGQARAAVDALCLKFAEEDEKRNGSPIHKNPWMEPKAIGVLPNGHFVAVFLTS